MRRPIFSTRTSHRMARWWLCLTALCACVGCATSAGAESVPARVLVLYSGHRLLPAALTTEQTFRATLDAQSSRPIEYYYEAVDEHRNPSLDYESSFVTYLTEKYRRQRPDLVFAIHALALEFVVRHRQTIWPDTPVVFAGVDAQIVQQLALGPSVTGITESVDWAGTLDLAQRLQPDAQRLVIVTGVSEYDRRWLPRVEEAVERLGNRFAVSYLSDLSMDQLASELARLPRDTIILHTSIFRDAAGHMFVPREAAGKLAAVAGAPSYAAFSTHLGNGVVGGSVIDIESQGKAAAQLALRVLGGERAADLPPRPVPNLTMVDWRELERWGMSESLLPDGAIVRFRQPSLWQTYRWLIIGTILILVLQSAMIVALLVQRRRRRQAEIEAEHRRAELVQASRLALAGELTASIAHEINQPLGAILAYTGAADALLRRGSEANDKVRQIVADIRTEDVRAGEIIRRVRGLVMRHEIELEPLDVNALIGDVLGFISGEATRRGILLESAFASGIPVLRLDRVQLQQAIVNLCVNAMDAMAETDSGQRQLTVRTLMRSDATVEIHVSDRGPGISAEQLPRLFDSFFTTKPHGTGLGLSITRSIVEAHGGRIRAENRSDGGAIFIIELPIADAAPAATGLPRPIHV